MIYIESLHCIDKFHTSLSIKMDLLCKYARHFILAQQSLQVETRISELLSTSVLGSRIEGGITDFVQNKSEHTRAATAFQAEFDALLNAGHVVAADVLQTKHRRLGFHLTAPKWESLMAAWHSKVTH